MGFRDRIASKAAEVAVQARDAAGSVTDQAKDRAGAAADAAKDRAGAAADTARDRAGSARDAVAERAAGAGVVRLLRMDEGERVSAEALTVQLAAAVRRDDEHEDEDAASDEDVFRAAKRRYRRVGTAATPFGPPGDVVADLYCEAATLADVVALRGDRLSDETTAAHLLVLWGAMPDFDAARDAIAGTGPTVLERMRERTATRAQEARADVRTKRGALLALWRLRGSATDAVEDASLGVRGRFFPGRRVTVFIGEAHAQLDSPPPGPASIAPGAGTGPGKHGAFAAAGDGVEDRPEDVPETAADLEPGDDDLPVTGDPAPPAA